MGGFGTAKFISKYPHLFKTAMIYDGALLQWPTILQRHANTVSKMFNNNEQYFNQFSPWAFVAGNDSVLKSTITVRMAVGAIKNENRAFRDTLMAHKIAVEYVETTCDHNLGCLTDAQGVNSVAFIAKQLSSTTQVPGETMAPLEYKLFQNYPNPFNPTTTIGFTLQSSGHTTVKIYDALGREVATLVNEHLEAGINHQRTFDASKLSSGIYFARLQSNGKQMMKKLLLMK